MPRLVEGVCSAMEEVYGGGGVPGGEETWGEGGLLNGGLSFLDLVWRFL